LGFAGKSWNPKADTTYIYVEAVIEARKPAADELVIEKCL